MKRNIVTILLFSILIGFANLCLANSGACYIAFKSFYGNDLPGLWEKGSSGRQDRCFSWTTAHECNDKMQYFKRINKHPDGPKYDHLTYIEYEWREGEQCRK